MKLRRFIIRILEFPSDATCAITLLPRTGVRNHYRYYDHRHNAMIQPVDTSSFVSEFVLNF